MQKYRNCRRQVVILTVLADTDCGQILGRMHHIRSLSRFLLNKSADMLQSQ